MSRSSSSYSVEHFTQAMRTSALYSTRAVFGAARPSPSTPAQRTYHRRTFQGVELCRTNSHHRVHFVPGPKSSAIRARLQQGRRERGPDARDQPQLLGGGLIQIELGTQRQGSSRRRALDRRVGAAARNRGTTGVDPAHIGRFAVERRRGARPAQSQNASESDRHQGNDSQWPSARQTPSPQPPRCPGGPGQTRCAGPEPRAPHTWRGSRTTP